MPVPPTDSLAQAESWLADHGDALLAYAARRVSDAAMAEDLVQETLLAGLQSWDGFRGQSVVRTWLTSILRRKVADYYRRLARESACAEPGGPVLFDAQRQWIERPARWPGDPAQIAASREFQTALAACVDKLPPVLRVALQLRVFDELKVEEICSLLDITPTNLSVRLARARMALRECLHRNWFAGDADQPGSP